jgi:hypothetical protein
VTPFAILVETKAKSKAAAKAEAAPSAVEFSSPTDPFAAAGFQHPFHLQALGVANGVGASGSNGAFAAALPISGLPVDPLLPSDAATTNNGFDYSHIDFSNIDPALLPTDPMDVLAAHGGAQLGLPVGAEFVPYDYPVPVPAAAVAYAPLPGLAGPCTLCR